MQDDKRRECNLPARRLLFEVGPGGNQNYHQREDPERGIAHSRFLGHALNLKPIPAFFSRSIRPVAFRVNRLRSGHTSNTRYTAEGVWPCRSVMATLWTGTPPTVLPSSCPWCAWPCTTRSAPCRSTTSARREIPRNGKISGASPWHPSRRCGGLFRHEALGCTYPTCGCRPCRHQPRGAPLLAVFARSGLRPGRERRSAKQPNYLYAAFVRDRSSRWSVQSTIDSKAGPYVGFALKLSRIAALILSRASALAVSSTMQNVLTG